MEPPSDYHADNSRSDLSDILEEDEEDLYSDHLGDAQARGYTVGGNRVKERVHYILCGHKCSSFSLSCFVSSFIFLIVHD